MTRRNADDPTAEAAGDTSSEGTGAPVDEDDQLGDSSSTEEDDEAPVSVPSPGDDADRAEVEEDPSSEEDASKEDVAATADEDGDDAARAEAADEGASSEEEASKEDAAATEARADGDDGGAEAADEDAPSGDEASKENAAAAEAAIGDDDGVNNDSDGASVRDGAAPPMAAAWGLPLVRLERAWSWAETRVMFVALMVLTVVLCVWLSMRGIKEPVDSTNGAGWVFRALVGAAVLGGLGRFVTGRMGLEEQRRNQVTVTAVILGVVTAGAWRSVGIGYWNGVFDWLQQGSVFALFGGLKGLSTRLTMLVALIGASLAAAAGTHINIDVFVRLIPAQFRKFVAMVASLSAAAVCLVASWGFLDHIAIAEYGVGIDEKPAQKVEHVTEELDVMFFAFRKQLGFDLKALPVVIAGDDWNAKERFTGRDWNAFLAEEGYVERFGEEKVAPMRAPDSMLDEAWTPVVQIPEKTAQGFLLHGFDLLWPLGFLAIGLRFILRVLLIASGHVQVRLEGEEEDGDGIEEEAMALDDEDELAKGAA
ncbi:MAG: TRAP transporter small permease subunit [Myxococcota bacterium]